MTRLPLKEEYLYTFRRRLEERAPGTSFGVYGGPLKARFQQRGHGLSRELGSHGGKDGTGLVVAYWSFDLREHPMGYLTRGLFCSHQVTHVMVRVGPMGHNNLATPNKYDCNETEILDIQICSNIICNGVQE